MNYLDIVFIIPLLWAAWKGFQKGLIIEVATLLAFALAVYGGIKLSDTVAEKIAGTVEINESYLPLVSFAVTFLVIVLAVYMLGKLVEKVVDLVALSVVNKVAGAVFGAAKIALVISVILTMVNSFDEKANVIPAELKEESMLYEPLSDLSTTVIPALKESHLFSQLQELTNGVTASPADTIPQ